MISVPSIVSYWNNLFSDLEWKKVWCLPSKNLITNKVKEVSFRMIRRFYPTKPFLQRFREDIVLDCTFCNLHPENLEHLFWACNHTALFWRSVCNNIFKHILPDFSFSSLSFGNVLFGFISYPSSKYNHFYIINLILLLAKFHIHKLKFNNQRPSFTVFLNEAKQYIQNITNSRNPKAMKTIDLCITFELSLCM